MSIAAAQDADGVAGTASFKLSSAGLPDVTVTATEVDDDIQALAPVDDAWAYQYEPTLAHNDAQLRVKLDVTGGNRTRETYLKFDLDTVPSVGSALLRLIGYAQDSTTQITVAGHGSTGTTWTETTLTWNNRPAAGAVLDTETVSTTIDQLYEWDVTSWVRERKAAGERYVTLAPKGTAATTPLAYFHSDEATDVTERPRLLVTPATPPANNPPVANDATMSVAENSANGTAVGTYLATDPDAGQTLVYAITAGNADGAFAINAGTGAITVADGTKLDYETATSRVLTVTATDNGSPNLSDPATVTINVTDVAEAPPAPAGLAATAGAGNVTLTWSAVSGATGYRVYRGTTPGGQSPTPIASDLTAATFTDTTAPAGQTHYYTVKAFDLIGESALSNEASASPTVAAPTGVTAAAVSSGQVDLQWSDVPGTGVTYSVYVGTSTGFALDPSSLLASGLTASAYSHTTASASTAYYYTVVAVGPTGTASGGSPANGGAAVTTPPSDPPEPAPLPGATTGLHVSDVGTDSITFVWRAAPDAATYNLYRSVAGEPEPTAPYRTGLTATAFTDGDLPPDGAYRYSVAAVNAAGAGSRSLQVSAAPTGPRAGTLDPTFGADGKVIPPLVGSDIGNDVLLMPDGQFVTLSYRSTSSSTNEGVAVISRYNPDGTPDTSFGSAGIVVTDLTLGYWSDLRGAVQPDGKVVLVGAPPGADSWVARYRANGSPDTSFGNGGRATFSFGDRQDKAWGVALRPDGAIVVAGFSLAPTPAAYGDPPETDTVLLARFRPDGQPDGSFGAGGKVTASFPSGYGAIRDLALQSDGKIVLAGGDGGYVTYTGRSTLPTDHLLMRFYEGGALDTSFGTGGHVVKDFGNGSETGDYTESAHALTITPDARIIAAGNARVGAVDQMVVARYLPNGASDATFGNDGEYTSALGTLTNAWGITTQANGKVVVTGYSRADYPPASQRWTTWRLHADGAPDATFAEGGVNVTQMSPDFEYPRAVVAAPDGGLIITGTAYSNPNQGGTGYDLAAARFVGDGLNLVMGGLGEERHATWTDGAAEPPHETDPGAFVPLNDDFDEADPEAINPLPDKDAAGATAEDDELVHASLVFTGSHEQSGWMLDFPDDKVKVYEQRRSPSTGALTLYPIARNVPQPPPEEPVVNVRIEGLEVAPDLSLKAYLLPPGAAGGTLESTGTAQDEIRVWVPPVVSIEATDPQAYENLYPDSLGGERDAAEFTVRRNGPLDQDLTVYYKVAGTAVSGTDFEALPGEVRIPAGEATANVVVRPIVDGLFEDEYESVDLTIDTEVAPGLYTVAAIPPDAPAGEPAGAANVVIADAPPSVDPDELYKIIYPETHTVRFSSFTPRHRA